MKQIFRLTKVELRRLLMNKKTYILMCMNILLIMLGYNGYLKELIGYRLFSYFNSASMEYTIYPFCLGCLAGSVIWGISIIADADRFRKRGALDMVKSHAKEEDISAARILSYAVVAGVTCIISMLVYLPVSSSKMQFVFDPGLYLLYATIAMLPGIIMALLICDGFYNISKNVGVSILILLILTAVQFLPLLSLNCFFRWNAPQFNEVSDSFVSEGNMRLQIYSRVVLLLITAGFWGLSRLFLRKYQFGAFRSFIINSRTPIRYIPIMICAGLAAFMIIEEPFVDHSPIVEFDDYDDYEMDYFGEYSNRETHIDFNYLLGTLKATTELNLIEVSGEEIPFYINSGITIKNVTLDGKKLEFETDYDRESNTNMILAYKKGVIKNPDMKTGKLVIEYEGYPAISGTIFATEGYRLFDSIGRSYIKLSDESLCPDFIGLMGFNHVMYINVPSDHVPFSWGNMLKQVKTNPDGSVCWKWEESEDEMTPQLISAPYCVDEIEYASANTTFGYGKKYSQLVEANDMDGAVSDVMNFCDTHFGALKLSDEDSGIRIQQISNDYGGGGAGLGYVYMDERFMSPKALNDEKTGTNLNETFMHEIIHLFWGDMGCWLDDDGLWSAEGLTVYTTYRIVKEKYGELYAKQYYVDKWKEEVMHQNNNFYFRHPEYLELLPESYKTMILESEDGINKYSRMPLMLLKAEEKLGGEEAMDAVLSELYENGAGFGMTDTPTTFQDFLDISGLTEEDLKID